MWKPTAIVTRIAPVLCLFLLADDALARAGGFGGSSGRAKGVVIVISLICTAIYFAVVAYKNRRSEQLLDRIAVRDPAWDRVSLRMRIGEVFDRVQRAWMQRDQEIARDCMSEALYLKHKRQTDEMLRDHERNVLERIRLTDMQIVGISEYEDNARDCFWVFICGSMIDYTVDDRTGRPIDGNIDDPEWFKELWKFVRTPRGWVVDEIDPRASLLSLADMGNFSEDRAVAGRRHDASVLSH